MFIGEEMSKITDINQVVEDAEGDLYENTASMAARKPLDIGRSVYVRLRWSFDDSWNVEVYWDHFQDLLFAVVKRDNDSLIIEHLNGVSGQRADRLDIIEAFVQEMQNRAGVSDE